MMGALKMKIKEMGNFELLEMFENVLSESVKACNGWSRRSEAKLNIQCDKLKKEILKRMK